MSSALLLLIPCVSVCFAHLDYQSGGDPLLEAGWEDLAGGGAGHHFKQEAPSVEMRFCLTQHTGVVSERSYSAAAWSIPYFSLSLPIRGSTVGFRRNCLEDHNCRSSSSSSETMVSSGAMWSNSVWCRCRLRPRVGLRLEAGVLTGEIVEVRGFPPHLFFRRRQVGGQVVSGSVSFCPKECKGYGGVRHYIRSERSDEFWVGVQKVTGFRGDGRVEIVYRPHPDKTRKTSQALEFRFGARERISEVLWLSYGFATLPSPFVLLFVFGCGVCQEGLSMNTAIRSSFLEDERIVQVSIGLSTRL